ncbi:MAG: hypothetical protein ACLSS0_17160 [Clostridioides difficile]
MDKPLEDQRIKSMTVENLWVEYRVENVVIITLDNKILFTFFNLHLKYFKES